MVLDLTTESSIILVIVNVGLRFLWKAYFPVNIVALKKYTKAAYLKPILFIVSTTVKLDFYANKIET